MMRKVLITTGMFFCILINMYSFSKLKETTFTSDLIRKETNSSMTRSGFLKIAVFDDNQDVNQNEFVVTSVLDLTNTMNEGKIACLQSKITLTQNITLADGLILKSCGGYLDLLTYTLTGNNSDFYIEGTEKVIDAFNGTIKGTWGIRNKIFASNIGALDDGQLTTDNFNVGKNLLYLARFSKHVFWNKKDKGIYYRSMYNADYGSPFFTNGAVNDKLWIIGTDQGGKENNVDGIHVELGGDVEIRAIPNEGEESVMFDFYNTTGSKISGGTLRGDRYQHDYDQILEVKTAGTNVGTTRLRIIEHPDRQDNLTKREIDGYITLLPGTIAEQTQQIVDAINTNPIYKDYTANLRSDGRIDLNAKPGVFYTPFFTEETSNADVNEIVNPYEWAYGVRFGSNAIRCKIENIRITEFHGDAISRDDQGNGQNAIRFDDLTQGVIESNGSIDNTNTDYYYLTNIRKLPTHQDWFMLRSNSEATFDLAEYHYYIAYYDANDNFIEMSPELTPYELVHKPINFVKYRLMIKNSGLEMNKFYYFINSPSFAQEGIIENCLINFNRRHGMTNLPIGTKVIYNKIHDNGGVEPESGINIEDYSKAAYNYYIGYNEFWGHTAVDIILKGCSGIVIEGNKFRQDGIELKGEWNGGAAAIAGSYARNYIITNNEFDHKSVSIDLNAKFIGNTMKNTKLVVRSGGAIASNNIFENSRVIDGTPGGIVTSGACTGSPSYVENNKFYINRSWGNRSFIDEENTIVWKNNTLRFNHEATQHSALSDPLIRYVDLNNALSDYQKSNRAVEGTNYQQGSYSDFFVEKLKAAPNNRHHVGWSFYAAEVDNAKLSLGASFDYGFPKSFRVNRLFTQGWLRFNLNQYSSDGVEGFKTIIVENSVIKVPENISAKEGLLNNTQFGTPSYTKLLRIAQDKNVNFVFKNVEFINNDDAIDLFMYLGHRGTTIFDDCKFVSKNLITVDLNKSGGFNRGNTTGVNTGVITFKSNNTYKNVNFIPRIGTDIIKLEGVQDGNKGDITISESGSNWVLNPTGVTAGTYSNSNITIDTKGRITNVSNGATSSFNGGTITEGMTMFSDSNLSPMFRVENTFNNQNYRLQGSIANNTGYLNFRNVSTNKPSGIAFTQGAIYPSGTNISLGASFKKWTKGWFSGKVVANEFEIAGGTSDQFLKADGSIDNKTYISTGGIEVYNINRTLGLNDNYKTIVATTNTPTYTVPLSSNVAFPTGKTEIVIVNQSTSAITITSESGVSILTDIVDGLTIGKGGARTLRKIATNSWVVGY